MTDIKQIVQCEDWGEKTKQSWGWDWALRNFQPTIFVSTARVLIMKWLEAYFFSSNNRDYPNKLHKEGSGDAEKKLETKESKSNEATKKSSYDQEDRTIKVRHFHPEWKNTFPWVIYKDGEKILQIILPCCNQEGLPEIYSGLVNFQFK